jgi:hypothetical protein
MLLMIQRVPPITRATTSVPKARANELFILSLPVVKWRKNTSYTPICAIASAVSATGIAGAHIKSDCAIKNAPTVKITESTNPIRYIIRLLRMELSKSLSEECDELIDV